jgi:hypothetical protein
MTTASADWSRHGRNRVDGGDWDRISSEINDHGCATTPQLLLPAETEQFIGL